jgi:glycerol transport system ATP-binding protein
MARIELREIAHDYLVAGAAESTYALKPVDLVLESGGAYALLGPSGCGKTTLLNIVSGLLRPTRGALLIDGRDVTALAPEARNIAQVFQFPVVYDSMTVFDNLAFPLRNRGHSGRELSARVERIAELLELTPWLSRKATRLGADLKQRVSLGRGLVRTDVAAILLDEPLTVIDPHAKWLLRRKLKQIHAELAVTLLYVTHDQVEALTLADEVLVMNEGRVLQRGTPQQLFERPEHTFVGYFIGSPGMNLLRCELEDACAKVEGQALALDPRLCALARQQGDQFTLGVRPELVRVLTEPAPGARLAAEVIAVEQLCAAALVKLRIGAQSAYARVEGSTPAPGSHAFLELPPAATILYADGRAVV